MSLERLPLHKGRPFVLVGFLIGVIVAMGFLSKCGRNAGNGPDSEKFSTHRFGDTLTVAIEISPLVYNISGDSITGIDYDIITAIAQTNGKHIDFRPFASLQQAMVMLETGACDIVISHMPVTENMKKKYRMSDAVYLDREVLVQRADAPDFIDSPEQLGNDSVWIAEGSPFSERLRNLSEELGEPIHIMTERGRTAEHLVMLTARGVIPRAVVNEGLAKKMKQDNYPELDISTPVSFTQFQSWIISASQPELCDSINSWLGSLKETDRYKEIIARYY